MLLGVLETFGALVLVKPAARVRGSCGWEIHQKFPEKSAPQDHRTAGRVVGNFLLETHLEGKVLLEYCLLEVTNDYDRPERCG